METFDTMLDWMVMHQVRLMQLSILYQTQAQQELDETEEEVGAIATAVASYIVSVGGLRLDDVRGAAFIQSQIQRMREVRSDGFVSAFNRLSANLRQAQAYEAQFYTAARRAMGQTIQLSTIVVGTPSVMGDTMDQWQERLLNNDMQRLKMGLNLGARLGENEAALRARLLGQSALGGIGGAVEATRRELDTLVRTATDVFADLARVQIDTDNGLQGREVYVAILDSRTTKLCAGYHGKTFEAGRGPRPPLHWYCRSTRVPLVGERTPSLPSYREWLNRLSARDQDEVLGPRQGAAFRAGTLAVEGFREPAWRGLDLKRLAKRERLVFEAAGMDVPFQ